MLRKVIISLSLCMYGDTNCECFRRLLTGLFLRTRRFGPWCCQAQSGSFSSNSAQFSRWVHYIIQIRFELTPSTSTVTRYSPMWPTKCLSRVPPHCRGQSQCTNLCKNPSQLILPTTHFLLACALLVGRPWISSSTTMTWQSRITSISLQRVSTTNLPVWYDTILTLMASCASRAVTILV